jgi:amino acid permease
MKKFLLMLSLLAFPVGTRAWDEGSVKSAGSDIQTFPILVSSFTATQIISATINKVNTDIMNNSAFTLWIGTNTTTLFFTGFPILASATYTLDGKYTGSVYGLVESGTSGSQSIRTILFKNNQN